MEKSPVIPMRPSPTSEQQPPSPAGPENEEMAAEIEAVKYFIRDAQVGEIMVEDRETMELVRLPTCAIFHKLGAGTGVPPSFLGKYYHHMCTDPSGLRCSLGFIKQWPALPRVVVRFGDFPGRSGC